LAEKASLCFSFLCSPAVEFKHANGQFWRPDLFRSSTDHCVAWSVALLPSVKSSFDRAGLGNAGKSADGPVPILGVPVANLDVLDAIDLMRNAMAGSDLTRVAFLNAHAANLASTDMAYGAILSRFVILPDGIGVDLAARLLTGFAFKANLNGTDFVPAMLQNTTESLRVGLFGAAMGVAGKAATALRVMAPQHDYRVLGHGFLQASDIDTMLDELAQHPVDLILVALGNPGQELFIAQKLDARHGRVAMGVGALFDFLAGEMPRAPAWMRSMRMEWIFRFMIEPKRLFRRYILGNPAFLWRVMWQQRRRGRIAGQ
jgi:exopolysaccharide biosynthesis WecB/TagA/CpsF family protein